MADNKEEEKVEEAPETTHTFAENGETAVNGENGDPESPAEEVAAEKKNVKTVSADAPWGERMWEVFSTFWPLGLIAFGGPQAHVAILRDHLVEQRGWLDEEQVSI